MQGAQTEELPAMKALSALARRQSEGERSPSGQRWVVGSFMAWEVHGPSSEGGNP